MRVKVCGLTRLNDALEAARAGADMLGFIMAPGSPRTLDVDDARALVAALPSSVDAVGVFVDAAPAQVATVVQKVGFTMVQLHGAETWEDYADLDIPLIRAVRVSGSPPLVTWPPANIILADTARQGAAGGTGETFDWSLVADLALRHRLMVGGGLGADNVGRAVATLRPWGVDASSRLESAPGIKDPSLVREYVTAARLAETTVFGPARMARAS